MTEWVNEEWVNVLESSIMAKKVPLFAKKILSWGILGYPLVLYSATLKWSNGQLVASGKVHFHVSEWGLLIRMSAADDGMEKLRLAFKIKRWQDGQKRELLEHREKTVRRMKQDTRRLGEELGGLDRELERKKRELASLEQEEASLRASFSALTSPHTAHNTANSSLQQVS